MVELYRRDWWMPEVCMAKGVVFVNRSVGRGGLAQRCDEYIVRCVFVGIQQVVFKPLALTTSSLLE